VRLAYAAGCLALLACAGESVPSGDQVVDLGTHSLHAHIMGTGFPAIVVDTGIAAGPEEWRDLQARLARSAMVITFERAGYGDSGEGPMPRNSAIEAAELRAMLEQLGLPGPFVLVGHSLGGLNAQVFAARYPDEVAALVLLDPPPLGWLLGDDYPALKVTAEGMTVEWEAMAERDDSAFFRAIASEHREMFESSARLAAAIESFGDLPLHVIASGVANPAFGEEAEAFQRFWIGESRALATKSSAGTFDLVEDSSHMLNRDAPDIVLSSILSVRA